MVCHSRGGRDLGGRLFSSGTRLETEPEVVLTRVGAALHAPVWSYRRHTLLGLTDDQRLAEVTEPLDAQRTTTRLSSPMAAGRNLQISQRDDGQVFVPKPQRGEVAVVDLASLRPIESCRRGSPLRPTFPRMPV